MQAKRTLLSSSNIKKTLANLKINLLAKEVGYQVRKPRKIRPIDFILSHWQIISQGEFSYDKWAIQLGIISRMTVSGQAVFKRMNKKLVGLIKALLENSFRQVNMRFIDNKLFYPFNNVYIQDATHFPLPRILHQIFPGSYSRHGKGSTAKIQATFSLKKGIFSSFTLNSFRDNDQKDSPRILNLIEEGDLFIRDLGYFVLEVFKKATLKKAFFLSRLKYGVNIFNAQTGKQTSVAKLMKSKQNIVDIPVLIGAKEQLQCRLVIIKVPECIANERIRRAKKERNKRSNHDKNYFKQLAYTVFITNVEDEKWSAKQVQKAYMGRWYIETIFKAWKSNLKIRNLIPEKYINETRAEFLFYSSLLMINTLVLPTYLQSSQVAAEKNKYVSILKTCDFISKNIACFFTHLPNTLIGLIAQTCQYEVRKTRINAIEAFMQNDP